MRASIFITTQNVDLTNVDREIDRLLIDRVSLVADPVLVHFVVLTDLLLCLFLKIGRDWALVASTVEWVVIG